MLYKGGLPTHVFLPRPMIKALSELPTITVFMRIEVCHCPWVVPVTDIGSEVLVSQPSCASTCRHYL